MEKLVQTLGITSLSKSQVSVKARDLDEHVAMMVATGVNGDGHREILGVQVASAEDGAGWLGFFRDLTARALTGVKLVTSDAPAVHAK